jgi:acetyltransferase-like isoleucine patch superfamily enzyme
MTIIESCKGVFSKGPGASPLERFVTKAVRPLARSIIYRSAAPPAALRPVLSAVVDAEFLAREAYEFARRSLVATPLFLSRCASHGVRVAVDRLPYMTGPCRIEVGDDVRISGLINISPDTHGNPTLKIGNGVFIGHGCSFDIADRIEIGNFVAIGSMTYLADTDGHATGHWDKPVWEVKASPSDIAPVVIEDGVQIGKRCLILKGVRIGARSIIGNGSVVRSDIPPDSVVLGNPARVVRRLNTTAADRAPAAEETKG